MMINTSFDSSLVLQSAYLLSALMSYRPPVTVCQPDAAVFLHKRLARLPLFQLLPAKQQETLGKFPLNVPWFCAKFTLSIKCFLKTRINSFCLALAFPVPIFLSARPAAAFLQKSAP